MSQSSGATISRCVIVNNDSAGMYQCDNSMMSRLLVSGNGNYGIYDCDLGVIENSVIAGNRISGFIQSTINVLSCTVVGNLAYGFQSHTGDIDHTIIWNNPNGPLTSSSTPVFSATFDPYFVRSGHWSGDFWNEGDYHLMPDSRVIDAGNPSYGNDPNEDLDGNPRIVGSRVDIGAYEFQTPCEGPDFDGDRLADPCDPDIDDDGVSNTLDPCDFTPLWAEVDADGRPRGDLNLDCKVDLRDAAIMQRSLTGP